MHRLALRTPAPAFGFPCRCQHSSPGVVPPRVKPSRYNLLNSLDVPRTHSRKLNVILMCDSFNGLSKSVYTSLTDSGHDVVKLVENPSSEDMIKSLATPHDLIIAPFLTKHIPQEVYQRDTPCMVVHPGILGDRGASSLDWAIRSGKESWGVTVLNASDVMDGGNVWATCEFPVREGVTKSSLYREDVTPWAVSCVKSAINKFVLNNPPTPLDYNNQMVTGGLIRNMKTKDRTISWETDSTSEVISKIKMSDSRPGASASVNGTESWLLYGAHEYQGHRIATPASPGSVIGQTPNGHTLLKTKDSAVWVSHAKNKAQKLKLPASTLFEQFLGNAEVMRGPTDIWAELGLGEHSDVAFVHFDCYNGAMSTQQCHRLRELLASIKSNKAIRVVCLMGGQGFFSNGIHLNVIEGSDDPTQESWENINSINDVVREIFSMEDKLTVSVLQGSAGAGGAMMALAADHVVAHRGVTLSPSYQPMGLCGSEYWTYFLPQRVGGRHAAEDIESSPLPMSAKQACQKGMVDKVLGRDRAHLISSLPLELTQLKSKYKALMEEKLSKRTSRWYRDAERARRLELLQMKECFQSELYNSKRRQFVYN